MTCWVQRRRFVEPALQVEALHAASAGIQARVSRHAKVKQFGRAARGAAEPALDSRTHLGKGFAPLVSVMQLLDSLASGGVSLADVQGPNVDGLLTAFLDLAKFPDQTTVGEWLRALGAPGWQVSRRINRNFCSSPWPWRRPRGIFLRCHPSQPLWFDHCNGCQLIQRQ